MFGFEEKNSQRKKIYTNKYSNETTLNLPNLTKLTEKFFNDLNDRLRKKIFKNKFSPQKGGAMDDIYDNSSYSNIKDLYINVKKYMALHMINHLNTQTLIPYGIILSTLNLPNDLIILNELYPNLVKYLSKNDGIDNLYFDTLIPIGIFLGKIDINNINHLTLQ